MADGIRMGEKVVGKVVPAKPKSLVKGEMVPSKAAQQKEKEDVTKEK